MLGVLKTSMPRLGCGKGHPISRDTSGMGWKVFLCCMRQEFA